ncbi:cytochrome P450 [Cucurbitaria berberidis CBS 394.84]|uniref:Cytochrome P450 n=1 Tax=Cucurbitaria berberidis CBS 394.84 TaxID=1168544 RepID=A0A9P4L809_9PLEO|nr:cytochrome P450 [Cucurbitaria berberidis CBS 394.84]KAF1844867.1 cytochrome P450 [Cucurbitaria berberidis CBS 394.84]
MSPPLLVYAFGVFVVTWVLAHAHLVPKPISGIPYNTLARYMPWGDLITLGIHNWLTGGVFDWFSLQCLKHRSPLIQVFIPSFSTTHPTVVLAELREIEDIVTRRAVEVDRADTMHIWFGIVAPRATIGMKSEDRSFKEQRRLWNVVLSPRFLEDVAVERFGEVAVKLADLWKKKSNIVQEELAFQVQDDMRIATLDGIWKMNVGSELGLLNAKLERLEQPKAVRKSGNGKAVFSNTVMPEFYSILGTLLMVLDWVMQGISPRMYTWFFNTTGILARAAKRKDEVLKRCIAISRERVHQNSGSEPIDTTCALGEVMRKDFSLNSKASEAASNGASGDDALTDELLELLITGHETTASSISWALKFLTDHPEVQSRLRTSLYAAFPNSTLPTAKDIYTTPLSYLDAVIAETLRLSLTGPISFRQTLVQCDILGHTVPAGTPLVLVTAGPSYDSPDMPFVPEYLRSKTSQATYLRKHTQTYPIAPATDSLHAFNPARWIREDGTFAPDAVHMLPFSAGPRGCFGKKIALLEMRIMLAVLMMRFEFPRLRKGLSGYGAVDGLTRRPTCCYVQPKTIGTRA